MGALGAAAGTAALGLAGRAAIKRTRRQRVFRMRVANGLDLKKLAEQIGNAAERLERTSEDVRVASAQAKRVSRKLA